MRTILLATVGLAVIITTSQRASAQAPSVLWSTNVGTQVFAVDTQTNVYTRTTNGTVIILDGSGIPAQTNVLNTRPGIPFRDASGDYYYAGVRTPDGPCGGLFCTYTNPALFLAKYTSGGSLVWSNIFGPLDRAEATDIQIDNNGNIYVAWRLGSTELIYPWVGRFDTTGSNVWDTDLSSSPNPGLLSVRLGPVTATNAFVVVQGSSGIGSYPYRGRVWQLDAVGSSNQIAYWEINNANTATFPYTHPAANSVGDWFMQNGNVASSVFSLVKRTAAGSGVWTNTYTGGGDFPWVVGSDHWDGFHLARTTPALARYDVDGNEVWTLPLTAFCSGFALDAQGNRFFSLANGTVARLGDEPFNAPAITNSPQPLTIFSGSNAVFTVGATGTAPLRYYWLFEGSPLAGKTNSTLTINGATFANSGLYSVIVSNGINSVTSTPVLLDVKRVAIFQGAQMLTNGTYTFTSSPSLKIVSAFPSGSSFYTLDGSTPSFGSTFYSGPFVLTHSALVRAIGYSSDFLQSEEAGAVNAIVLTRHTLTATASGGGSVGLNPSGGNYIETNIVTATATPSAGWSFLYWLGDVTSTGAVISVSMERDKAIKAVFGTTLSTTVAGSGQVLLNPGTGPYAYGSTVRLTAVPQTGNYFGFWGNAATGNTNPLFFTITAPTQTVSSIFGAVGGSQAALTIQINGLGRVTASPRSNIYTLNQSITLTAVPDADQTFIDWTGDASGTQNPLNVTMSSSKVITANFTSRPTLSVDEPLLEGMTSDGFRLTIAGSWPTNYKILCSSNLVTWDDLGFATNQWGEVQFTDSSATNQSKRLYRARLWP